MTKKYGFESDNFSLSYPGLTASKPTKSLRGHPSHMSITMPTEYARADAAIHLATNRALGLKVRMKEPLAKIPSPITKIPAIPNEKKKINYLLYTVYYISLVQK